MNYILRKKFFNELGGHEHLDKRYGKVRFSNFNN